MDIKSIYGMAHGFLVRVTEKLLHTLQSNHIVLKVNDLIDPSTKPQDEKLERQTFWRVYVHRILAIPLPNYYMVDFVVWGMAKKIRLSVKSSYYVEWDHIFGGNLCQPNGQETMQVGSVWQLIWSLDCPAKVKNICLEKSSWNFTWWC